MTTQTHKRIFLANLSLGSEFVSFGLGKRSGEQMIFTARESQLTCHLSFNHAHFYGISSDSQRMNFLSISISFALLFPFFQANSFFKNEFSSFMPFTFVH